LSFFSFAIKFVSITLFFALVVIYPVNRTFEQGIDLGQPSHGNGTSPNATIQSIHALKGKETEVPKLPPGVVWLYVAFVYLFSSLAIYLLVQETRKIIHVRQGYLGSQSSITDRTLRLSGIPPELRSEEKIKEFVEDLQIGKVDSVMLCRNWKPLDTLISERMACLRRLEEAWTAHLGYRHGHHKGKVHPPLISITSDEYGGEHTSLLLGTDSDRTDVNSHQHNRPQTRVRYGVLKLRSKKIDAIDYYEAKLHQFDEDVKEAQKKEYEATPLAFVTMESTVACQMAVQASLDSTPGQLIAILAPPPADLVWQNTYLSRRSRMCRSWSVMAVVGILTIFWVFVVGPFAALLEPDTIEKYLPSLGHTLKGNGYLVLAATDLLPTLAMSLLGIIVPYLYDWLSHMQGMTCEGDMELSLISKNFLFTFFNLFIVFTVFGTAATLGKFQDSLRDILKDTSKLAYTIAKSLGDLTSFYVNLIILQGIGLFPFRLLEFGAVAMYPVSLIASKTPRDYADLVQPPVFNYGYFVPQVILVFIICTVYSVLDGSWKVLLSGLLFFIIGKFVYKYQLLYAMDHRQHSTGRAWPMICNRVFVGLVVFQIAMSGWLALKKAFTCSLLIIPLVVGTIWFNIYFQRTFDPLMKFIALRSIGRRDVLNLPSPSETRWDRETDGGRTVDTTARTGMRYVNPSLAGLLDKLWIHDPGTNGHTN
jgi:calcium permeable stress-gated cation channel